MSVGGVGSSDSATAAALAAAERRRAFETEQVEDEIQEARDADRTERLQIAEEERAERLREDRLLEERLRRDDVRDRSFEEVIQPTDSGFLSNSVIVSRDGRLFSTASEVEIDQTRVTVETVVAGPNGQTLLIETDVDGSGSEANTRLTLFGPDGSSEQLPTNLTERPFTRGAVFNLGI